MYESVCEQCNPPSLVTDCSVCSEGHTGTLSFTCIECVNSRGGVAIVISVGIIVLFAGIALCMHLVSGEVDGARPGIIHRVIKRLPVQSIKIVVVMWQILTQVRGMRYLYSVCSILHVAQNSPMRQRAVFL